LAGYLAIGSEIGYEQFRSAPAGLVQDGRLRDALDLMKRGFNLLELDSVAEMLDLIILTSYEVKGAVRAQLHKVARPIHALVPSRIQWILPKNGVRPFPVIHVSKPDLRPEQAKLTCLALRSRPITFR
jgi:hypothetical protein